MVSRRQFSSLWQQNPSQETSTRLLDSERWGEPQPLRAGRFSSTQNYVKAKLLTLLQSNTRSSWESKECPGASLDAQGAEGHREMEGTCRNPHFTCTPAQAGLKPPGCWDGAWDRCCSPATPLQQQGHQDAARCARSSPETPRCFAWEKPEQRVGVREERGRKD